MNREELIAELQRVAKVLERDSVSVRDFQRHGHISVDAVKGKFGSWNKAVAAAGLAVVLWGRSPATNEKITDEELRSEFMRVHSSLNRVPTKYEIAERSKFNPRTYKRRFGNWRDVVSRCLGSEGAEPPREDARNKKALNAVVVSERAESRVPASGRPGRFFGPPLNFRELRHEPVNEQGVVLLFGMVARELGFLVDAVGTGYPDCRAKRQARGAYYTEVDIEF